MAARIDPRAVVSPKAQLADDVEIGPFAVIGDHVVIGPRCWIGPHAVVNGPTTLGADNRVFQFASLGDAPQDKKYKGEPTRLEVGERNIFREYCTVNRGTVTGNGVTRIGDDNMLLAYTHVGHDCTLGNKIVLSNLVMLGGHVELGDWVIMSGYAGAHQFSKIGAHAFIGNNTAVTRDVPPYVLAAGHPAEPRSINSEGLKRRGFTAEQIRNIKNAYRVLYRSDLKLEAAVEQLKQMAAEHEELRIFVDFIGQATRSLVR
jgi:UDP-N-acetylglucosamine acyltransferase